GSSSGISIDVRFVCATNRLLRKEVAEGRFREDLFYRIGVVEIALPPLRERADDIPELASRILKAIAKAHGRPEVSLTAAALRMLMVYPWPGNVRELENVLTKSAL